MVKHNSEKRTRQQKPARFASQLIVKKGFEEKEFERLKEPARYNLAGSFKFSLAEGEKIVIVIVRICSKISYIACYAPDF